MRKNAYWVLSRDTETTELKFSKLFWDKAAAHKYIPYFKRTRRPSENVTITLEMLPYGVMPKMKL
jgi:hypothetical protein